MSIFDIIGFVPKVIEAAAEGLYEGLTDSDPIDQLSAGDIIGIDRLGGVYEHYAVYIGNKRVIHYAAEDGDFGEATIHEAPFGDFLNGQSTFFVLDFSETGKRPDKKHQGYKSVFNDTEPNYLLAVNTGVSGMLVHKAVDKLKSSDSDIVHIYSPAETVERAKGLLGENKYSLIFNNCEHFAVWCKTGVHKSYQVEDILGITRAKRFPMLM